MERAEKIAFEMFAHAYPHEAAEIDFAAFAEYTRQRCENPDLTDEQIREVLQRTSC
jgi:hypothetical protein